MPSERVQRQIDRLLDQGEEAISCSTWLIVRDRARAASASPLFSHPVAYALHAPGHEGLELGELLAD